MLNTTGVKNLLINQHYFMEGPGNRNLRELLEASRNSLHEEDCEIQLLGGTNNVKIITKQHTTKITKFMDKYKEIGKNALRG
jgi:hypothetical protein